MLYRKMGKLDEQTSLLGLGCMRLPVGDDGAIDKGASIDMIRQAIDGGVNYLDTAFTYPKSEKILGEALKDGYREKVYIADKIPPWLIRSEEDKESLFSKSLERLDVDAIDFFLVHNLNAPNWKKTCKWNLISFLDEKKKEGKIRHLGFSFHDEPDLFKEIIDSYDWDFCQIQLNYMDKNYQAGLDGLDYAAGKGMGVVVMEPLKGGRLVADIPPTVQTIWDSAETSRTPVEWAFKWLAADPRISVILSGSSSTEQLNDSLRIFNDPTIDTISDSERELLDKVADEYRHLVKYGCTGCKYCLPCPNKLDIPNIIRKFNDWVAFSKPASVKFEYLNWQAKYGSDCISCGQCEEKCPQTLPIMAAMKDAAEAFGR